MRLGGLVEPGFGQELLAVPFSLLQQELSHLGHVFGLDEESPSSCIYVGGTALPFGSGDAQRTEQAR